MVEESQQRLVGLIGWPVDHSLSPLIQEAAFAAAGLPWRYLLLPVPPQPSERIREAVLGLRALGFRGANVTVPHKRAVIPALDHLSEQASLVGAVNTIWQDEAGLLWGDNTDTEGFVADLCARGIVPRACGALVLGAGGSARAVVVGLARAGCPRIQVLNRSSARARELVHELSPRLEGCRLSAGALTTLSEAAGGAELIVNCTPLGMAPEVNRLPWDRAVAFRPDQIVYDLVYTPQRTALLELAESQGARALSGLGMLLHQGALAFTRWTGRPAPLAEMGQALAGRPRC